MVAFPIAGFPKSLPGSEQYKAERENEVYSKKEKTTDYEPPPASANEETPLNYKQILKSVKILLTNPTFMFLNLAAACEGEKEKEISFLSRPNCSLINGLEGRVTNT